MQELDKKLFEKLRYTSPFDLGEHAYFSYLRYISSLVVVKVLTVNLSDMRYNDISYISCEL